MGHFNKCCCCNLGSIVSRWQNDTKVRPAGDTGGTHYTSTPYQRFSTIDTGDCPSGEGTTPFGTCGNWLGWGDEHGFPAQIIEAMVDDIMACAADDFTHMAKDHNCYTKSETDTVDMRMSKLFGYNSKFAQKFRHGALGWNSNDACAQNPNIAPDQNRYLTFTPDITYNETSKQYNYDGTGVLYVANQTVIDATASGSNSVNRLSGIITSSLWTTENNVYTDYNADGTTHSTKNQKNSAGGAGTWLDTETGDTFTQTWGLDSLLDLSVSSTPYCVTNVKVVDDIIGYWNAFSDGRPPATVVDTGDGFKIDISWPISFTDSYGTHNWDDVIQITVSRSETVYRLTGHYYHKEGGSFGFNEVMYDVSGTFTLSAPYTAGQFTQDLKDLMAAWDMSDITLEKLRTDEILALASLMVYDEVPGSVSPLGFYPATMADYTGQDLVVYPYSDPSQPYHPFPDYSYNYNVWKRRPWHDPNDYVWTDASNNEFQNVGNNSPPTTDPPTMDTLMLPDGSSGGGVIHTGLRQGDIIAHTQAGSDAHFWFGYNQLKRDPVYDPDSGALLGYQWTNYKVGGNPDTHLANVTMRWMDNFMAQYDGHLANSAAPYKEGVFSNSFFTYRDGRGICGKMVQATQKWPATNYGRPCGADKYAVDQTTVVTIVSGSSGSWTVRTTKNTVEPLAAGGLAVNDYIIASNFGCYQITAIIAMADDAFGRHQWTIAATLKDTLPAGYVMIDPDQTSDGFEHIGKMRFPTASGIAGRAAVMASYDSSTNILTITSISSIPYLRDCIGAGIKVDLYDSAMTSGTKIASVAITRVDDTHWTATMTSAPAITVAYMTGAGVDWTKYSSVSQRTGVFVNWTFDYRAAQAGYTPSGYLGNVSWYQGQQRILSCTAQQFNYLAGNCAAMVGIVPFYSQALTGNSPMLGGSSTPSDTTVEQFPNQQLFDFPAVFPIDEVFGSHWQGVVYLTMVDPFWQEPFAPDGDIDPPDDIVFKSDDGSGIMDSSEIVGSSTVYHRYYAHEPYVEASYEIPSGDSLPAGIMLPLDPTNNILIPPFWPDGIPIGDDFGNYGTFETDWGFTTRACADIAAAGRFSNSYRIFVSC